MKKQLQFIGFIFLLLISSNSLHAQWDDGLWVGKQANNWIFYKDVGLNFNTSPPMVLTDCETSSAPGGEGAGTFSDEMGNLLFSVSRDTIWNKNYQLMLNGDGILSNYTTVQNGLTVPVPNSNNLYYVFNTDHNHTGPNLGVTLTYSIVDMNMDGGLGKVIDKNIPLAFPVGDKLTAIHHADGERVWVVSHKGNYGSISNNFLAFLVSESGIAPPVISAVGPAINYSDCGQMKASPDGSKIAYADGAVLFASPINLQVFDFDNQTGQITNPIDLSPSIISSSSVPLFSIYGLEFSPNSRFLYAANPGVGGFIPSRLHQFDLQAGNQAAILASHTILKEEDPAAFKSLQLASNGKIYMANSNFANVGQYPPDFPGTISVIHYPNNPGVAAGFDYQAIDLQGEDCGAGLPGFIQSYFESGILHEGDCAGNEVSFSTLRIPGIESAAWDFGDPNSGADNTATTSDGTSIHVFSGPGTYTVTAAITSNGAQQTAVTEITIIEGARALQPPNILLCGTDSMDFDLTSQNSIILDGQDSTTHTVSYHTSQADAENNLNLIANPGDYPSQGETIYARVTSDIGCYATTQFALIVSPEADLPDELGLTGCSPFDLTSISDQVDPALMLSWYSNQTDAENETNAIVENTEYMMTENEATIYLRGETDKGCYDIVEMHLIRHCETPIPQGISPNGDAFNQNFDLSYMNIQSLEIFNRHGRSVFTKESYTNEWFGQTDGGDELPTGTYFYVIKLEEGQTFKNKNILTGWVYLNRQVN